MLKQMSGRFLCSKVTTKSVVKLFMLADRHAVTELMTCCIDYIRGHSVEVMATKDWKLIEANLLVAAFCPQPIKDKK